MHGDDAILLTGLACYGFHGVHAAEQSLGQRFIVDLRVETDLRRAAASDALNDTVSYSDLARRAKAIVEGPPRRLIERVAGEIATMVLTDFPLAAAVSVTIRKPNAPIRGIVFETAAVTLHRRREELT